MRDMSLLELDQIRDECRQLVAKRAMLSGAVAVVPIPGLDITADVAIMSQMLEVITAKFGLTPAEIDGLNPQTKQRILVIITSIGSSFIGKFISKELIVLALKRVGVRLAAKQAAKFVPLLGSVLAAGISYGAMRMLGNSHIEDCYQVIKALQADGRTFEHETVASDTQ